MGLPFLGGLIDKVIDKGGEIFDDVNFSGEERAKAELERDRLHAELGLKAADIDKELALGQIDVNKIEAASGDRWVSGWRPFIGWVCGCGFAYAVVGFGLMTWCWNFTKALGWHRVDVPLPPPVETELLLPVLMGILGLGAMRTIEKVKGKA